MYSSSVWKLEEKKQLERSKCRYGYNTEMDFKWVVIDYVSWIYVALDSFIHSLVFSLRGRAGRNQSPVM